MHKPSTSYIDINVWCSEIFLPKKHIRLIIDSLTKFNQEAHDLVTTLVLSTLLHLKKKRKKKWFKLGLAQRSAQ